jgi:hypothetical protein
VYLLDTVDMAGMRRLGEAAVPFQLTNRGVLVEGEKVANDALRALKAVVTAKDNNFDTLGTVRLQLLFGPDAEAMIASRESEETEHVLPVRNAVLFKRLRDAGVEFTVCEDGVVVRGKTARDQAFRALGIVPEDVEFLFVAEAD